MYQVTNTRTGAVVAKAATLRAASAKVQKLDAAYGAAVHAYRWVA